jgi:hypothetical protein
MVEKNAVVKRLLQVTFMDVGKLLRLLYRID